MDQIETKCIDKSNLNDRDLGFDRTTLYLDLEILHLNHVNHKNTFNLIVK